MYNANLISKYTYAIDSGQRARDAARRQRLMEQRATRDSLQRAEDSVQAATFLRKYYLNKNNKR
jgi:hypothetical protein